MSNFDLDPKINARAKKNLMWVSIFGIIMIFAGFTSAYIVSKGSEFWVKIPMPTAFTFSTIVIILSSIALFLVPRFLSAGNIRVVKILIGFTFLSGLLFTYYQTQGWQDMFARGNAVSDHVINQNGRYGQFYTLTYQGKEITYDGYDFYWSGNLIDQGLKDKMLAFGKELMAGADFHNQDHDYILTNYGTDFVLKYEGQPVTYANGQLSFNGQPLAPAMHDRLWKFSECIVNGRGDFMMTGRYGEDFSIYYKGEQLTYENRVFYLKGKRLSAKQENDLQGSRNKNSSYIYVFTFMHLLHLIGGLIAMLVIWIRSIQERYTAENYLGIQLGSIYWHFLGILWIYLYLFLIFIH